MDLVLDLLLGPVEETLVADRGFALAGVDLGIHFVVETNDTGAALLGELPMVLFEVFSKLVYLGTCFRVLDQHQHGRHFKPLLSLEGCVQMPRQIPVERLGVIREADRDTFAEGFVHSGYELVYIRETELGLKWAQFVGTDGVRHHVNALAVSVVSVFGLHVYCVESCYHNKY